MDTTKSIECSECAVTISARAKRCPACGSTVEAPATAAAKRIEDVLEVEADANGYHIACFYYADRTRVLRLCARRTASDAVIAAAAQVRADRGEARAMFDALGII